MELSQKKLKMAHFVGVVLFICLVSLVNTNEIRIALQGSNGKYLARCRNCVSSDYPDSVLLHETNPFNAQAVWRVQFYGDKIALKSDNNKYLSICSRCIKGSLRVPRQAPFLYLDTVNNHPEALWTPYSLSNNKIALKGNNNRYLGIYSSLLNKINDLNYLQIDELSPQKQVEAQWKVLVFK